MYLSGDLLKPTFECVRERGHFVEIGITNAFRKEPLRQLMVSRLFLKNIKYYGFRLDRMCLESPLEASAGLADVVALFREKKLHPIPFHTFPPTQMDEAFRYMSKGKHIGKVLIQFTAPLGMVCLVHSDSLCRLPFLFLYQFDHDLMISFFAVLVYACL